MMIKIQQGREEINSNGGIILTGALLRLNGWEKIDRMQPLCYFYIRHPD